MRINLNAGIRKSTETEYKLWAIEIYGAAIFQKHCRFILTKFLSILYSPTFLIKVRLVHPSSQEDKSR